MSKSVVSNEFVSYYSLEMALLLHAGIGVEDGLQLLTEDEPSKAKKRLLNEVLEAVVAGDVLSMAMRKTERFPEYVCDMVETGEKSGRMEQAFQALSEYYEDRVRLGEQVRTALLYPVILLLLMLFIVGFLLVKVLPVFDRVYAQLGGGMTGGAAALLEAGKKLEGALPVLGVILLVFVVVILAVLEVPAMRDRCQKIYKRCFGTRGISRKVGTARFAAAMSMGMQSGLHTEDAFQLASKFYDEVSGAKAQFDMCARELEQGVPLAKAIRDNRIMEPAYCRILELGVKSGAADTAMTELARRLNEDAEMMIQRMVGRIEPTIVIISSCMVGMILLTVMLPLLNIMASIG